MVTSTDTHKAKETERNGSVRAVERALQLIEVFARSRGPHAVTDLAERLSLPTTTVHRLVQTLVSLGYVTQYPTSKRYGVGRGIAELNRSMLLKYEYSQHVQPHLEQLVEATGETASLAALYGTSAIYLNQVETPAPMRVSYPVGTLVPLHCSAVGKVFLADFHPTLLEDTLAYAGLKSFTPKTITKREKLLGELKRVKQQNYALEDEEYVSDARCIAVGLRGSSGTVVSTLSISGPTTRMHDDRLADLAKILLETAHRFAEQMREP
jgi:DNA-binding IclR family transcriptional regulator